MMKFTKTKTKLTKNHLTINQLLKLDFNVLKRMLEQQLISERKYNKVCELKHLDSISESLRKPIDQNIESNKSYVRKGHGHVKPVAMNQKYYKTYSAPNNNSQEQLLQINMDFSNVITVESLINEWERKLQQLKRLFVLVSNSTKDPLIKAKIEKEYKLRQRGINDNFDNECRVIKQRQLDFELHNMRSESVKPIIIRNEEYHKNYENEGFSVDKIMPDFESNTAHEYIKKSHIAITEFLQPYKSEELIKRNDELDEMLVRLSNKPKLYVSYEKAKNNINLLEIGISYEHYIADILLQQLYEVSKTPINNDYGVDIVVGRNNIKAAIQCKYWVNAVGVEAIQQVYSGMIFYDCHYSIVVSNSDYTYNAKILAKKLGVLLVTLPFKSSKEKINKFIENLEISFNELSLNINFDYKII